MPNPVTEAHLEALLHAVHSLVIQVESPLDRAALKALRDTAAEAKWHAEALLRHESA